MGRGGARGEVEGGARSFGRSLWEAGTVCVTTTGRSAAVVAWLGIAGRTATVGMRSVCSVSTTLSLVRFDGDGTPVFTFSGVTETFVDSPDITSRWQIQLGLRYLLN